MEQGARFVAAGKYEIALGEYRAILGENPRSPEAYFAAAEVRVKMKKYKDAVENYRLAYQYDPSMKDAYQGAAKAFKALGEKDSANAELQKMKHPGAKADKQDKSDRQDKATAKSGTAVLLATHDPAFAAMADRRLLLADGVLRAEVPA